MAGCSPESDWRNWSFNRWNHELFRSVFESSGEEIAPLYRIEVTDSYLAKLCGAPDTEGAAVREAFLANLPRSRHGLRSLFDSREVLRNWASESAEPRFFAQLYFSLMVASATAETHQEGNFRRRFGTMLGLDADRDYVGPGLPRLWERSRNGLYCDRRSEIASDLWFCLIREVKPSSDIRSVWRFLATETSYGYRILYLLKDSIAVLHWTQF